MNTISIEKKNYINRLKSEVAKFEQELSDLESGKVTFQELASDPLGVFEAPTQESTVAWINSLIINNLRTISDELAKVIMDDDTKSLYDLIS